MAWQGKALVAQVRGIAARIAAAEGLELVDAEWKGGSRRGTLRVFIDKPAGVTHADCERVSHQLSATLDVEDLVPGSYNLEVSSPGLDRKLFTPDHFRRFTGSRAIVRLCEPPHGARHVTGRIAGSSGESVVLRLDSGSLLEIRFEDIELARLAVEL